MNLSILNPCIIRRFAIAGSLLFLSAIGEVVTADEPVVVFRSVDEIRQRLASWNAENLSEYDREPIVEVKTENGKPSLGIKLDDDPLGPEVMTVVAGSAADMAGMKKGDHLKSINNAKIDSAKDAAILLDRQPIGVVMDLEFRRNNYTHERRIRFLPATGVDGGQNGSSDYLRDRVEELESRLIIATKRNGELQAAVQFLLDDRQVSQ